ncbi:MAG: PglZ domain-containing protein [Clostridia bacterium]|nr:PglZ domain-containing protein [Clostridia bacterium]
MDAVIQNVFDKLFNCGEESFVVVYNHDGFLLNEYVFEGLKREHDVAVFYGDSLDLRIAWETRANCRRSRILFIKKTNFPVIEDIARNVSTIRYKAQLERSVMLSSGDATLQDSGDFILRQIRQWGQISNNIDFNKPTEWIENAGRIILDVLEKEQWRDFSDCISIVNEHFFDFLKSSYNFIVSSSLGRTAPRIVTQVLPFIARFNAQRKALIVVDGMNYWQSLMLREDLERRLDVKTKSDCIFSWLPSVTELSRQAIFRGGTPLVDYVQGPSNEKKLWIQFWESKGIRGNAQYYQHGGTLPDGMDSDVLAYVTVSLDEKMHASDNYMYLYDNTRRWLKEGELTDNVRRLLNAGYKVFITTDHGNIEGVGYRTLDNRDRLDAWLSYRHITLNDYLDRNIFEEQYVGHLQQIDENSRTYYAVGTETFSGKPRCVTHGGPHFLEVLIPFITIN